LVHQATLAEEHLLSVLRLPERAGRVQAQTVPIRCREKVCAKKFSVRTNSVMECSKIGD